MAFGQKGGKSFFKTSLVTAEIPIAAADMMSLLFVALPHLTAGHRVFKHRAVPKDLVFFLDKGCTMGE